MVQSDLPIGRTKSGKINAKWYLDRLKSSNIYHSNKRNSNSSINTHKVYLTSPNQQNRRSNSTRSNSITNRICSSLNEKDNLSIDRSSSNTNLSIKPDLIERPPSTPVDKRCQRIYSPNKNSIEKETCQLLGPQLCSDCIENELRSNLSYEYLPKHFIRQHLSSLAIRKFIPNQQSLNDEQLLQIINNQQKKYSDQFILTDQQYFQDLSSALNQYSNQMPFYFKDLKHFSYKYQSNKYPRLLLNETPPPQSENPIFKQSSLEKFDISSKYSFMKRASTVKPNFQTNAKLFISTKKSQSFYKQHRYLIDYSPPLLLQRLQFNSNSLLSNQNKTFKHSLINSKSFNE